MGGREESACDVEGVDRGASRGDVGISKEGSERVALGAGRASILMTVAVRRSEEERIAVLIETARTVQVWSAASVHARSGAAAHATSAVRAGLLA